MNTEETTPTTEELGATPAEVEQEGTEEVAEEVAEETTEEPGEEAVEEVEEVAEEVSEEEPDTSGEEPAEEITPTKLVEEAKEMFPGREFKDDGEVYQALVTYKQENDEANARVIEVLRSKPAIGDMIRDMAEGATWEEAIATHMDMEAVIPKKGEEGYDAYLKGKKKKEAMEAQYVEVQKEITSNHTQSGKNIEKFRTDKKLSDTEINSFTQAAHDVIKDVQNGLVTPQFLDFMYKGMNHDLALAESRKQAEIKGLNKNIVAKKAKQAEGDGMPGITSQGQPAKDKRSPEAVEIVKHTRNRNRFS